MSCCSSMRSSTIASLGLFSTWSSFPIGNRQWEVPSHAQSKQFCEVSPTTDVFLKPSHPKCTIAICNPELQPAQAFWCFQSSSGSNDVTWLRQGGGRLSKSFFRTRASRNDAKEIASTGLQDEEVGTAAETSASGLSRRVESVSSASLPTMEDIIDAAAQDGIQLTVNKFGPTFEIVVSSPDGKRHFGSAQGFIRVWTKGKILHLESVRLERGLSRKVGNIFGAGFFVGAAILRYGLDHGCRIAQLMAIYDDKVTHSKLVKYYSRLGFKVAYEVDEEDWRFLADRVMWGGVGTRMDADCEELVRRWAAALRPKPRTSSSA